MVEGLIKLMNSEYNDPINLGSNNELSQRYCSKTLNLTSCKSEIVYRESNDDPKDVQI